jgi:hypothetical protein
MIRNGETSLEAAAERLARALDGLEARLADQQAQLATAAGPEPVDDSVRIELREAKLRERALEAAAAEASAVLGRAAERIQLALDEAGEDDGAPEADTEEPESEAAGLDHLSDDQTDLHPSAREF